MTASARAGNSGYSLVELVVVLLLLSFITLAVGGGMRFGSRVWESSEGTVENAQHTRAVQSMIRELLGSAVPASNGEYVEFDGTPAALEFEAVLPEAAGITGIVSIRVVADQKDSQARLKIAISKAGQQRPVRQAVWNTDAQSLHFAYLDASEVIPAWLDRWRDRNRLPDAVRIEAIDDVSKSVWPVLVVRLPIAQTPLCSFDPVSTNCRGT